MKRGLFFALVLVCFALTLPAGAQDGGYDVRTINVQNTGYGMRVSPDGSTLALYTNGIIMNNEVFGEALPIQIIDVETGDAVGSLSGPTDYVQDAAFTPDGTRLVTFHRNGDLYIWDVEALEEVKRIRTTLVGGGNFRLLEDGETLVALMSGIPNRFLFWNLDSEAITEIVGTTFGSWYDFSEQISDINNSFNLQFSTFDITPDGAFLAVSSFNDEVKLWELETEQSRVLRVANERPGQLNIRAMQFTPDGERLLYSHRADESLYIMDLDSRVETPLPALATIFALSPDGAMIGWVQDPQGDTPGAIYVSALEPFEPQLVTELADGQRTLPQDTRVFFTPDGERMIVGGFSNPGIEEEDGNPVYVVELGE